MRIRLDYFLLNSYLALLIPLSIYCLILFQLNRRNNPVMISGMWDSIGLLFAGSGFLLVTGPNLVGRRFEASMSEWIFVWIVYYLFLVIGSVLLVWSRRDATVIYNVDADLLNQVLERVLDKLDLGQTRIGHALMIGPRQVAEANDGAITDVPSRVRDAALLKAYPLPARLMDRQVRLDVEPFPAMSNVTLSWRSSSPALRQDVEDELRRNLDECRSLDNPTAGWFLGISSLLFGFILMVLLLMLWVSLAA